MKTMSITLAELKAMEPCNFEARKAMFRRAKSIDVAIALERGATIRDVLWVARKLGRKDLCVKATLGFAQRTAHLNPDPRVQEALDATQAWLDDQTEEKRKAAADAAYAAAAAYAAYAAAYAAAAYAAAADAAADAAYGGGGYAARQKEIEAQKQILIEVFSLPEGA